MRNALILIGSRNTEGQTAKCANAIANGLTKAGASPELIFLPILKIERCRQCDPDGWGVCHSEGRCVIEDDFALIVKKIHSANLVIFATPVYFGDLSESMRAFLDRFRRITFPQNRQTLKDKATIGICVAGGGGSGAPSACFLLERVLQTTGFQVVDIIPVRRQNINTKIQILKMIGEWLATGSNVIPSANSVHLGAAGRWFYKVIVYLVYVLLGRWRHKRV